MTIQTIIDLLKKEGINSKQLVIDKLENLTYEELKTLEVDIKNKLIYTVFDIGSKVEIITDQSNYLKKGDICTVVGYTTVNKPYLEVLADIDPYLGEPWYVEVEDIKKLS